MRTVLNAPPPIRNVPDQIPLRSQRKEKKLCLQKIFQKTHLIHQLYNNKIGIRRARELCTRERSLTGLEELALSSPRSPHHTFKTDRQITLTGFGPSPIPPSGAGVWSGLLCAEKFGNSFTDRGAGGAGRGCHPSHAMQIQLNEN